MMLSLFVHLEDIKSDLVKTGNNVEFGKSFLSRFPSSQLVMSTKQGFEQKEVWIGEDADPFASGGESAMPARRYQDHTVYEGVRVSLFHLRGLPTVEIVRTAAGSSPLYVTSTKDVIYASWKFEDVVKGLTSPRPNREACRIHLKHGPGKVRDQIIEGIFMLWPGELLTFSAEGLKFQESGTPEIILPSTLIDSARATDEFVHLIADALRGNLAKSVNPVVELSGGYDSSCVALGACSEREGVNSYGLIHEGAMGLQQRNRRRELVQTLGVSDFEYPSYIHTPLASLDVPECSLTPLDDNHRLPCAYAVDEHPAGCFDLILTGVGGDELTMENTFGRREWEVSGSVCTSAIVTATARADMFMRRGIWPVNPLIARPVVDFCRALPAKVRSGRLLNILTLARGGLSDGFLFPRYDEHYGNAMQREAALYDYDAALSESIIADFKIFDFSSHLRRAREASNGGFSYKLISDLYDLLKLERVLRRYIN